MNASKPSRCGLTIMRFLLVAALLFFAGCLHPPTRHPLTDWTAPSPDQAWKPPAEKPSTTEPATQGPDIPQDLLHAGKNWRLTDIIDISLRNNPQTRAAWHTARSAAADWLSKQGDYSPQVNSTTLATRLDYFSHRPATAKKDTVKSFIPDLEISWLLLDFGGRKASVEEKHQALLVADFTHNAAIEDAVLLVFQTYFQYNNAKALLIASEASYKEASTNLEMAKQRHENGLATIAEELLAQTALSQAKLNLDVIQGQVQTIRGALATAMGLPANTPYDTEMPTLDPPVDRLMESVDTYIKEAQTRRPDLAAQRSRVEQAMATVDVKRSALYPTLSFNNTLLGNINNVTDTWSSQNTAAVLLNIPLFKGYSRQYDLIKAKEDAQGQKARLDALQQLVTYQVWASYYGLKTSSQRVKTIGDLLKSAQQSYNVAAGRYKEGVGGILELLSAQSSLENARAQKVVAGASWFIAYAQLARDTGSLWHKNVDAENQLWDLIPETTTKEIP